MECNNTVSDVVSEFKNLTNVGLLEKASKFDY